MTRILCYAVNLLAGSFLAGVVLLLYLESTWTTPRPATPRDAGDVHGFIASPMESVFSRAPFLHNGSVMTLAELINLKPRRDVVYRGANLYDAVDLGLLAPDRPDTARYFRYDTHAYGNSNKGHDYPWAYQGPGWNKDELTDLLEYLKTF